MIRFFHGETSPAPRRTAWLAALAMSALVASACASADPAGERARARTAGGAGVGGAGAGDGDGGGGSGAGVGTSTATGTGAEGGGGAGMGEPCMVGDAPGVCVDVADCTGEYAPTPGYCPGPANIQCCTKLDPGTCDPNAMPLPNEGLVEAPGAGGCPPGMLPVDDFCIDQFEASLVHADTGVSFSPYFNPGDALVRAVSIEGAVPQAYIDQVQASDACTLSGKRLCDDAEWLRACQGPLGTTYPYGDALEPGVCNDARAVHPAVEYFGTSDDWIWSELGNACIDQLPDSLDVAGDNPGCITAEGAYDLMGNLHEWTADPAGTFRGGFYVDTKLNGPGCLYATTAHDTLHWDYSTGFRCCADP